MLNESSVVVKVWFSAVVGGIYTFKQVPNLANLREEVGKKLTEFGIDIDAA